MNPLMLYRSLPYIVIGLLGIALAWTTSLYLDKRDQLAALTASVQALGQAAEKVVEEKKIEHAANLETVRKNHEALASTIRASAVDNYRRANPAIRVRNDCSNGGSLPADAASEQLHDGTLEEPLLDIALIEEAASDANKLAAWQQWAQLNNIPVVD